MFLSPNTNLIVVIEMAKRKTKNGYKFVVFEVPIDEEEQQKLYEGYKELLYKLLFTQENIENPKSIMVNDAV